MQQYDEIKRYIGLVCEQIRWKKPHEDVSRELQDHITDQADAYVEKGMDEKAAVEKAIAEMGDPIEVGMQLDRVHRPRNEWGIIGITMLALVAGIFIRMLVPSNSASSIPQSLINSAVGLVFMFLAYTADFTLIGKYPKYIFGSVIAACVYMAFMAPSINGITVWISGGNMYINYILLFAPTAYAGVIYSLRNRGYRGILTCGFIYAVPAYIGLITNNMCGVFIYTIICLSLLTYAIVNGWFKPRRLYCILLVYVPVLITCVSLIFRFRMSFYSMRLRSLINPWTEPLGGGYINIIMRSIMKGSKLIGQGTFTTERPHSQLIPNPDTDFILSYLTHNFGLLSMIAVIALLLAFVMRLVFIFRRQTNVLGRLVLMSVTLTFGLRIFIYFLMNLGYYIFSPLPLPFIAYGGLATVCDMALLGVALSAYK